MKRLALLVAILGACGGGSDADVAGNYTVALTNRDNGCNLAMWTVGQQTTGVAVNISQTGSDVTADVQAGAGFILDVALGAHVYTGSVDGDSIFLEIHGTRAQTQGSCGFFFNSDIDAGLVGDTLSGKIEYKAATNGAPECASLENCISFQDFNGTRPP